MLFIDASREFQDDKNQNRLRAQDIDKIVENDFNLNIPRYVDTYEPEPEVDIAAVRQEIVELETELAEAEAELEGYLKELNL